MGFGLAAVAIAVVAIAVVAVGWLQSPPDITAAEAVDAARGAFRAAGVEEARVDPRPRADTYRPAGGDEALPVWRTSTRVRGGRVELWLAREDGEPVFLDDRSGDGAVQLLSDDQFEALAGHYENPATARQIRRNLMLTVAAALATAVAVQWDRQRRRIPRRIPSRGVRRRASTRATGPAVAVPAVSPVATAPLPARAAPLRASSRSDRPLRAQEIL